MEIFILLPGDSLPKAKIKIAQTVSTALCFSRRIEPVTATERRGSEKFMNMQYESTSACYFSHVCSQEAE
jgi:hypothetical protein